MKKSELTFTQFRVEAELSLLNKSTTARNSRGDKLGWGWTRSLGWEMSRQEEQEASMSHEAPACNVMEDLTRLRQRKRREAYIHCTSGEESVTDELVIGQE